MSGEKQDYHRASNAVVFGGMITYISGLFLLMAFISPYWYVSYDDTFTGFKNMGLWEYCFERFRYPYFQFDRQFDGCNHVFSEEYYVLREWLIPGWLLVVQTCVTMAVLLSLGGQILIVMIVIRWPLTFVLRYEWLLSAIAFCCDLIAGILLFLGVTIFGAQCWRRDWMMYPKYNRLSWSYILAIISAFFHLLGAFFLYLDARMGYSLRKESRNLVMQMQPNPQSHHGLQRSGYI